MSLGATLAADGSRPASFLPAIKCSQCGNEISVDDMGTHICSGPPHSAPPQQQQQSQPPQQARDDKQRSFSNPFVLRQWNASGRPVIPSPLSQSQGPSDNMMNRAPPPGMLSQNQRPADNMRNRAPHPGAPPPGMSNAVLPPPPRAGRAPPPRINPDAANKPFMGQAANPASPRSPSSRMPFTNNNVPGKPPPPIRSQTSPMPRIFIPRPPSEELSANLDCAFPPFISAPFASGSRPGSRNGSERGTSPASSRRDGKDKDKDKESEAQSPVVNNGDVVINRMHTMTKVPSNSTLRRGSSESKFSQQEPLPLDRRRRPSVPKSPAIVDDSPLRSPSFPPDAPRPSSTASSFYGDAPPPPVNSRDTPPMPSLPRAESPPPLPRTLEFGQNAPPQRPARPTESVLSPQLLDQLDVQPAAVIPPALNLRGPPIPAKSEQRPMPLNGEGQGERDDLELTKVPSAPAFGNDLRRPPLQDGSRSEPAHVPQLRPFSPLNPRSSEEGRDSDTEILPPPSALQRRPSQHAPSESGSSVFSLTNSTANTNSTHDGPSLVGSAASSVDTSSPLTYNVMQHQDEEGVKGLGLNINKDDSQAASLDGIISQNPPTAKQPPPKFTEPLPSPPKFPAQGNWPLESPMDPALDHGRIRGDVRGSEMSPQRQGLPPGRPSPAMGNPMSPPNGPMSSPDSPASAFSPYSLNASPPAGARPCPPMGPGQMRPRSRSGTNPAPGPGIRGPPGPRSRTPQGESRRPPPMRQQTMPLPGPPQNQMGWGGPPGGGFPPRKQSAGARMPPPGPRPVRPPPGNQMGAPPIPQDRPAHIPPRKQSLSRRHPPNFLPGVSPSMSAPPQLSNQVPPPTSPTILNGGPPSPFPQLSDPSPNPASSSNSTTPTIPQQPVAAFHPITGKPLCRGCGQQIEGKSVKAADGGLTGRWHKQCFVCRSCREAFTTADFYVIDNHPYCEQHYHEENGSLCRGCQKGIEGEYLETVLGGPPSSSTGNGNGGNLRQKFHPKCFTCVDCRTVLSADYFEIAGKIYCERHAMANMRGAARAANMSVGSSGGYGSSAGSPPGSVGGGRSGGGLMTPSNLRAERRTTKLMMM